MEEKKGKKRAPEQTFEEPRYLRYLIDNEVHHRGQGYVYLRELGVEPPAFYERSSLPRLG